MDHQQEFVKNKNYKGPRIFELTAFTEDAPENTNKKATAYQYKAQ